MSLSRFAAIVLIGAGISIQTTQSFSQKEPAPAAVLRISVDLVQVDAVVVDSEDRLVTDLQAEDFSIFQDGKRQKITNFSYIRVRSSKPPVQPAGRPASLTKDEFPKPSINQSRFSPKQLQRTIAIVADDLALSYDSIKRMKQSLKEWIDTEMQPGDLVAVIRTGTGISALQQFTGEKRLLYAAIDRIQYQPSGRVAVSSLSRIDPVDTREGALNTSQFTMENERYSTMASMGTIRYIANGLKDIPGRKSLIVFSESLKASFSYQSSKGAIFGQWRGDQIVDKLLRDLVESANRSTTVIYFIDPRGVINTEFTELGNDEYIESQNNMVRIAKETGGLFIRSNNDISPSLKTAVDDGNGYYLIGYPPDASTVDEMTKSRPKLHDIRVRVNKPGLRVRSRSRFFSVPSQEEITKPQSPREQINQALGSPFTDETVPVRLTPLFFQTQEGKPAVNALLHFDASKLAFSTIKDDWREASIDLVAATLDTDGRQVDIAYKRGTVQARGRTYENMLKSGVAFLMTFPVKNAGAYIMRVVLYDNKNGQLGSATQFVDIPDISRKELALSGIVLAAEELKPQAFSQQEGVIAYENSNGTAAVRVFDPGETIAWACQILNAKTDSGGKSQLKVQVRLFHEEKEINPEKPLAMVLEAQDNTLPIKATGQLQLKQLMPGHYVLQVIAFDALANTDHQIAAQSMDFEVRASTNVQNK
jgi:VWFA-related protein